MVQAGPEQGGGAGLQAGLDGLANPGDGAAGLWNVDVESPRLAAGSPACPQLWAGGGIRALGFEFCPHLGVFPLVPPWMCPDLQVMGDEGELWIINL